LTVQRHPLRLLRPGLRARGTVTSADLGGLRHGESVRIGGLVVARQRPGTAKGVVFLLIEDELGTVNLIVPPAGYERDRLAVRTEPLVMVDGTLERHAAAGGAINVLVRRLVALDAPDLLTERPAATVKDFSPLDERERQRILAEQPLVAAGGGAVVAAGPPAGERSGALAAVAGAPSDGPAGVAAGSAGRVGGARCSGAAGGERRHVPAGGATPPPVPMRLATSRAASTGEAAGAPSRPGSSAGGEDGAGDAHAGDGSGAEDFRAVAPPIMSFAQGRRR
jgi:hypothetical protein